MTKKQRRIVTGYQLQSSQGVLQKFKGVSYERPGVPREDALAYARRDAERAMSRWLANYHCVRELEPLVVVEA